jgi:putative DNA primase/helicase
MIQTTLTNQAQINRVEELIVLDSSQDTLEILQSTNENNLRIEHNSYKIILKGKLPDPITKTIKKRFKVHWSNDEKIRSFTFPLSYEITLSAYLEREKIEFTLEKIYDPYHDLTPTEKKIEGLDEAKRITLKNALPDVDELKKLTKEFNQKHGTQYKASDLLSGNATLGISSDPMQKTHFEIIQNQAKKCQEAQNKLQKLEDKIQKLQGSNEEHIPKNIEVRGILKTQDIKEQVSHLVPFGDVVKSLIRNERGDAELFLSVFKNTYLFDSTEGRGGEFYLWTGAYWKIDREKQRYRDIEIASDIYEKASVEAGKDCEKEKLAEHLSKRAFSLRSSKRCKSVFEFVSTEVHLKGEWDHCPGKLPCLNGIVDLKTGQIFEHKPEFLIRSICPTLYNPEAQCPLFDQFLDDITLNDKELKPFLGRVLGSALVGNCKEEKIFIFYGKDGRNGKGTLMQTLEKILGSLAKTFPSEMLLLQRNPPSSSTPRPEKANLQGVRLAIFSEIAEKRQIDASEVKNLSGGDTITCRRLFSNTDIQIRPSHTMFIQTNFKPKASAKDGALWKRTVLVPFKAEFVADPKKNHERKLDEGFKEKLMLEREGILAWLVKSCREYQEIGLSIPESVKKETENYRKENDGIERFLSERCIEDTAFSTQKGKMEDAIKTFCTENGCEVPTRNEISQSLKERYTEFRMENGRYWKGVKIVDERET